jgi:hypothetical protein
VHKTETRSANVAKICSSVCVYVCVCVGLCVTVKTRNALLAVLSSNKIGKVYSVMEYTECPHIVSTFTFWMVLAVKNRFYVQAAEAPINPLLLLLLLLLCKQQYVGLHIFMIMFMLFLATCVLYNIKISHRHHVINLWLKSNIQSRPSRHVRSVCIPNFRCLTPMDIAVKPRTQYRYYTNVI